MQNILTEIEKQLKPKYMNDVFTWKQFVDAFNRISDGKDISEGMSLTQFNNIHGNRKRN